MTPFTHLTAKAAPLDVANVDTDQIIPKQFLKTVEREGLAKGLFYDLRFDARGKPEARLRAERSGLRGSRRADRRRQLRLRLEPRARALGACWTSASAA